MVAVTGVTVVVGKGLTVTDVLAAEVQEVTGSVTVQV